MLIHQRFIKKCMKYFMHFCMVNAMITFIFLFNFHVPTSNKLSRTVKPLESIPKKNCTVIRRNPLGRLGNVLFEFATAYGLSVEHSCRLYIGPKLIKELNQHFELNLPDLLTESELNGISPIQEIHNHCNYYPKILQPDKPQHIVISGHWQAQKQFLNQRDKIREQLRFRSTVLDPVKKFIQRTFKNTTKTLVGVHIRRGDYLGQRNISSDQFISNAMAYFTRKYDSTKFILVSNDKKYIRNAFRKRNDTFFPPLSFNAAQDMALLTLCDHVIITVGTYGWWGGYLLHNRTGEVLTDSKPDHSPVDVKCEASIYFPPWFKFLNSTG